MDEDPRVRPARMIVVDPLDHRLMVTRHLRCDRGCTTASGDFVKREESLPCARMRRLQCKATEVIGALAPLGVFDVKHRSILVAEF